MAERFREFLKNEFIKPIEELGIELREEPRTTTRPRTELAKPVPADTPLAGMIHHLYIFDARDEMVVTEEFWNISVNENLITKFSQHIKEAQDTLIEKYNNTKLIGKPLGRGQVILSADSLADDDTLHEKLYTK